MKKPYFVPGGRLLAATLIALAGMAAASADQVNVYTERQQVFLDDIFAAFTEATGIEVEALYIDKGAVERLASEGEASPADVIILTDIGRLHEVVKQELSAPADSPEVQAAVPAWLRHPQGLWVALTRRARLVYAHNDEQQLPAHYEDLAAAGMEGSLCLRSGSHPYNVALFAAYLDRYGEEKALGWLSGLNQNLAREPQGNDRAQIKGVASGECRYAIANSYYYFKMLNSDDSAERDAAAQVQLVAPTFVDGGTHVNVSGAAIARHAPHPEAALALINFMVSSQAQKIYAERNFEMPVREDVAMTGQLADASALIESDSQQLADIAQLRSEAARLAVEAGLAK
ncbi:MAG: extracellular solute-binding protein [Betaproteobacteria bacterium]|nr:extracellular solute-binding protein [Betaproteobacteria bacterium]